MITYRTTQLPFLDINYSEPAEHLGVEAAALCTAEIECQLRYARNLR